MHRNARRCRTIAWHLKPVAPRFHCEPGSFAGAAISPFFRAARYLRCRIRPASAAGPPCVVEGPPARGRHKSPGQGHRPPPWVQRRKKSSPEGAEHRRGCNKLPGPKARRPVSLKPRCPPPRHSSSPPAGRPYRRCPARGQKDCFSTAETQRRGDGETRRTDPRVQRPTAGSATDLAAAGTATLPQRAQRTRRRDIGSTAEKRYSLAEGARSVASAVCLVPCGVKGLVSSAVGSGC